MHLKEVTAFANPGAFSFTFYVVVKCYKEADTTPRGLIMYFKEQKQIERSLLKALFSLKGLWKKMTVFKSLCSVCQHGGGNGNVGWSGVDWR